MSCPSIFCRNEWFEQWVNPEPPFRPLDRCGLTNHTAIEWLCCFFHGLLPPPPTSTLPHLCSQYFSHVCKKILFTQPATPRARILTTPHPQPCAQALQRGSNTIRAFTTATTTLTSPITTTTHVDHLDGHEMTPNPIPTPPSTCHIDIGANRCRIRLLRTTREYTMPRDLTSAVISAWEGLPKVQLATGTTTKTTTTGILVGGRLRKEDVEERCWMVGDIEEDGATKIGTPTADDDDDDKALLGIEGRPDGATTSPGTKTVRSFTRPPLPTLPTSNIGVPHTLQHRQRPQTHASPIIWVGEHESADDDLTTPVFDIGEFSGE
ncbi:hypothetical protein ARMSODRAFT_983115, partial [Armillaria solidipes]